VTDGAEPDRRPDVRAHLYGMKYSHPVLASKLALGLTGIPFRAHDILPGLHRIGVRLHGFRDWTVPALQIDSRRVQGTLAIVVHEDVRPVIAPRLCGKAALRLIPDYPSAGADALPSVPAAFPSEWFPTAT